MEAAVCIADPTIRFDPKYYQERAWKSLVERSYKLKKIGDITVRALLFSLNDRLEEKVEAPASRVLNLSNDQPSHQEQNLDS
jgi:hypothetical protein